MYQGRPAASPQAANDRHGSGPPARPTSPGAARRRRLSLAPVPESARAARKFTAAILREWQLDALTEDAVAIVSELATNAIRHGTPSAASDCGAGRVELSWCHQASRLICVVTDQTGTPPALAAPGPEAESGHGLQIVGALAVAWGWTVLRTGGKAVWAALELPGIAGGAAGRDPAQADTADSDSGSRRVSPAAGRDMPAAGRAADPGRRDPSPAAPLSRAAGWPPRCGAGAASARS